MSKQLSLKSIKGTGDSLKRIFAETSTYLSTLGFNKVSLFDADDGTFKTKNILFFYDNEKVFASLNINDKEEEITLIFKDLNIGMIYDIMTLKFQQISNTENYIILKK